MLRAFDEAAISRSDWDEAVLRLGGSIYMSYDWVRTWWEFYGRGKELRLFIFSDGRKVIGLLPLYLDSVGIWPFRLKIARLVGANIPPKVFDPAIDPEWAQLLFERVIAQIFSSDGCDLFSYGPFSELRRCQTGLQRACAAMGHVVSPADLVQDGVHTIFWLPATMEEYFGTLSKNERKNRRKYELRTLKKEFETHVEVISDPGKVASEFENFVVQHTLHWREQGKSGHFGAWPRATEFNRALVDAQGKLSRLRFVRIIANGQVVANQYAFAFGNSYVWELPARVVGAEWERFSLGPTGIVTMIGEAIKEGKTRLEGGLAHYEYKLRLGAKEYGVNRVRVVRHRWLSRARFGLFKAVRFLVLYGYHRIWYRRIIPRLPGAFSKPQWGFWLRLDF